MLGSMPLRRRPADPFEEVLLPAGRASRRARRLTLGRMRPPARLVARSVRERRRQVERFLAAIGATPAGAAILRQGVGQLRVAAYESPTGFWMVDADGTLTPDPTGRTGLSADDLRHRVAAGDLVLASDPEGAALAERLGR